MQQTLAYGEHVLSQSQQAYLAQLNVTLASIKNSSQSSILTLSIVTIGVLAPTVVTGKLPPCALRRLTPSSADKTNLPQALTHSTSTFRTTATPTPARRPRRRTFSLASLPASSSSFSSPLSCSSATGSARPSAVSARSARPSIERLAMPADVLSPPAFFLPHLSPSPIDSLCSLLDTRPLSIASFLPPWHTFSFHPLSRTPLSHPWPTPP